MYDVVSPFQRLRRHRSHSRRDEAELAGVQVVEEGAFAARQRCRQAERVTAGRFELDDGSAEVGEETATVRAGDAAGELEDDDITQG